MNNLFDWKDSVVFQFALAYRQFCYLLFAILLLKSDITVNQIGDFEFAYFVATFGMSFVVVGINQYYLAHKDISPVGAFKALSFVAILYSFFTIIYVYISPVVNLSPLALGFFALAIAMGWLVEPYFYRRKKGISLFVFSLLYNTIFFGTLFFLFYRGFSLTHLFVAGGLINMVKTIYFLWFIRGESFKHQSAFDYLRGSRHLILYAFFAYSAVYFDAWFVKYWFESSVVFLIYRYGSRENPIISTLSNGFSATLLPLLKSKKKMPESLRSGQERLTMSLFAISFFSILFSKWWFPFLFSADLSEAIILVDIFALLTISKTMFPQSFLVANNQNSWIAKAGIFELCLNIVMSIVLVSMLGLKGIAVATFIAFVSEKLYLSFVATKVLDVRFGEHTATRVWSTGTAVILILFYIKWAGWCQFLL